MKIGDFEVVRSGPWWRLLPYGGWLYVGSAKVLMVGSYNLVFRNAR